MFFVTQVDAFLRNESSLDPCAINTYTMTYPGTPVAKILQKSFKKTTWQELVIMYKRVELLVSEGIYGHISGGGFKSFLGANIKLTKLIDTETPGKIYLLQSMLSAVFCEERLLQNYARPAANYKWGFRSTRFSAKGFKTVNPLYTGNNSMEQAASLMFRLLAYNRLTVEDQERAVPSIHEAAAGYSIDIFRVADDLGFLRMLQRKKKVPFIHRVSFKKKKKTFKKRAQFFKSY